MEQFNWHIGQEITIRDGVFPVDFTFKIIGQIPVDRENIVSTTLWFPRQYLEEAMQPYGGFGQIGLLWVRIAQPEYVNTVITAIESLFRNSGAEVVAQTEFSYLANFFSSLDGLITLITLVGFLVVITIGLIATNTAAMSIRERSSDVAVLRTLGFSRHTIFALLLGEGILVATCRGVLGSGIAYLLLNTGKSSWSQFFGPLSVFSMSTPVLLQGIGLASLVGCLSSISPAWRAVHMNVMVALRKIL